MPAAWPLAPRRWSTDALVTIALLGVCLGLGAVVTLARLAPRVAPPEALQPDLQVTIEGEVAHPGLYTLPWGARVADLIALAGGLTAEADPALVTPAAPLTDGRSIIVPSIRAPDGELGRIDVNTASERLLTTLPGVGPVLAQRLIEGRPYHQIEDLLRVPGIGPARLEALRPRVTL